MVSYKKYLDIEIFKGKISKHQYPWHFHNSYTIIMVENGSISYEFQDITLKVNEAETLIIEPYKIHRNTISEPTVYKAFFLPIEYFEEARKNELGTLKVKHPMVVDKIIHLINKITISHL